MSERCELGEIVKAIKDFLIARYDQTAPVRVNPSSQWQEADKGLVGPKNTSLVWLTPKRYLQTP